MNSKIYMRITMVLSAILMFAYTAIAQTTIDVQVFYSEDDAEEVRIPVGGALGDVDLTSSDLELVFDSDPDYVGLIFREVQIPKGATITEAWVQFTVDALVEGTTDVPVKLEVWGGYEGDATLISGDPFSVSNRPFTTAMVPWEPGPSVAVGDAGENERTPDISDIITEIISHPDWASGNNMCIIVTTGDTTDLADKNREMESVDGDAAGAPVLHVVYEEGAPQETSISVQISDPGDDTEEVAEEGATDPIGTMDAGSSDLEFIEDDGFLQFVGMIFRNVEIPPNANITSAYIQFASDKALDGTPVTCKFFGGAVANMAAPFSEDLFTISSITQTIAQVSWEVPPFGDPGVATEAERSPDISSIIAEIVALEGWASGNNLMIGVQNDSDQKVANREAISYDGDPNLAPILNVTYNTNPVSDNQISAEFSSLIYPNPSEGKLNIKNPSSDKFSYQIYTINGILVASRHHITGATTEVDLSDLAKGMYFVNVRTADKTETHKIILR